jgi:hypothetical protein
MANTTAHSALSSWSRITNLVRIQAHEAYSRDFNLAQRIQYVHTYLLAKLRHMAQMQPAPSENVRQIVSAIAWYIWQRPSLEYPSPHYKGGRRRVVGDSPMWRQSAGHSCYTGCGLKANVTGTQPRNGNVAGT